MFANLSDTNKAAIFTVLVLLMALTAALAIRALGVMSGLGTSALYMSIPAQATVIMMLVVARDGYSREGWMSLGLHKLGLKAWRIAILAPLLVSVIATAIVWATPIASFIVPDGAVTLVVGFFVQLLIITITLSLGEELGWRGYLLPRLLSMGRRRALVVVGLVWAAWHMPLIFLTPLYHSAGNRLIVVPLFVGTIVAGSFVFGYLRLWTGSVWPAAIAHTAHNAAWGTLAAFTVTAHPVVLDEYLAGDNGLLILAGTVLVAVWLDHKLSNVLTIRTTRRPLRPMVPETPVASLPNGSEQPMHSDEERRRKR